MPTPFARTAALALALAAATAQADTVVLSDHDSAGLVAAMELANHNRQPVRIELADHGLYVLRESVDTHQRLGLPTVRRALTIVGHGAEIRRYSDTEFALIEVAQGGRLALQDVTLAEGADGSVVNRGILHMDGVHITDASGSDAALRNYGTLRGADSSISYNTLLGVARDAGVVQNYGHMELARSQISGNRISGRDNAIAASALLNLGDAQLTDVTIEGNSALDMQPGQHTLINLGNAQLHGAGIVLRDNWPDNWPQETPVARMAGITAP